MRAVPRAAIFPWGAWASRFAAVPIFSNFIVRLANPTGIVYVESASGRGACRDRPHRTDSMCVGRPNGPGHAESWRDGRAVSPQLEGKVKLLRSPHKRAGCSPTIQEVTKAFGCNRLGIADDNLGCSAGSVRDVISPPRTATVRHGLRRRRQQVIQRIQMERHRSR